MYRGCNGIQVMVFMKKRRTTLHFDWLSTMGMEETLGIVARKENSVVFIYGNGWCYFPTSFFKSIGWQP